MKVGIFFSLPKPYPLHKPEYLQAYSDLARALNETGLECFIVRSDDEYLGQGRFSSSLVFDQGEFVPAGAISIDLIFVKGTFPHQDVKVFNDPFITEVCADKWKMFQTFPQFCPQTWLVESHDQFVQLQHQHQGEMMVRKPRSGSEGHEVVVDHIENITPSSFPFLLQTFLDSSAGIPGIVAGTHDFRIAMLDGEIIYSYYRTPPHNSLVANVAQGGSFEVVPSEMIPAEFLSIVKEIDHYMAQIPHRFYGIDLALTPEGPKIIEMNSQLGILPDSDHPVFARLKYQLAELFKTIIQEQ